MQTTIDIDGDLVTRIDKSYSDARGAHVRELHENSIKISLGTWNSLVDGAIKLVGHFAGR